MSLFHKHCWQDVRYEPFWEYPANVCGLCVWDNWRIYCEDDPGIRVLKCWNVRHADDLTHDQTAEPFTYITQKCELCGKYRNQLVNGILTSTAAEIGG